MKALNDEFMTFSIPEENQPEKPQGSLNLIKSGSQTNLNALNSVSKSNSQSSRGSIFNTIGKGVLAQSTPDLTNLLRQSHDTNQSQDYYAQRQEEAKKETYNPIKSPQLDIRIQKGDFANPLLTTRNERHMKFDEYLSQYEQERLKDRNKSPGESRSKYFNDVFKSSVNLGASGKGTSPHVKKIMMEVDSRSGYIPKAEHGTPYKSERSYGYIPDMPVNIPIAIDEKELVKPKGRFNNWKPKMRNLESTFEVKDVKIRSDNPLTNTTELIDPTRRVQLGGRKLFMSKENGIERANNFSAGYIAPNYN
jgi:hypothetical protein